MPVNHTEGSQRLRQDENKMIIGMNNVFTFFSLTCMSTCTPMNFDRFMLVGTKTRLN